MRRRWSIFLPDCSGGHPLLFPLSAKLPKQSRASLLHFARLHLPVRQVRLQVCRADGSFYTFSSCLSRQRRGGQYAIYWRLRFHNEPDFGYAPRRPPPKEHRPNAASFPFLYRHQQAWQETRQHCFPSDGLETNETNNSHERSQHHQHCCGRHLHNRHAHHPAVQDRGVEPLRWAGERMRLVITEAGHRGPGSAGRLNTQDARVWRMGSTHTCTRPTAWRTSSSGFGWKRDGQDKHGMGFRQMPFLG